MHRRYLVAVFAVVLCAGILISCSSTDPNDGRVLTSITVTPAAADGQSNPNGIVFTATGTFNLPPLSAPVSFTAPYTGQFVVDNPTNPPETIAKIIATGAGTITVQCASGASGTVIVNASAYANNGTANTVTPTIVSGNAQLTCP